MLAERAHDVGREGKRGKPDRARHEDPASDQRINVHEGAPQANYRIHGLSRRSAHPVRLEVSRPRRGGAFSVRTVGSK